MTGCPMLAGAAKADRFGLAQADVDLPSARARVVIETARRPAS